MPGLISLADALARVLERVVLLPDEEVPLGEAAGRVLAADALALTDLPPFASSAMDGFALRAADSPGTLPVVARIAAGHPAERELAPGEAMGIATGGLVPAGADAVVPIEYVVDHDNTVEVPEGVSRGANVREQAGDVRVGQVVVRRGTRLGAAQVGALGAAGVAAVRCARRPRAALLTTGTELRLPGEPLAPGQIYDANGVMLAAQLASTGAIVEALRSVADEESAHEEALARGLAADVLVTSGGVSVGPHDLVRPVSGELGVDEVFWGVSMKPGKPVWFGVRGASLVFGLPGNPVSSLVAFELLVRPALLALQGASAPGPDWTVGTLASELTPDRRRVELVRARRREGPAGVLLEPLQGRDSHLIVRAAEADALVLVQPGVASLPAGTPVRYLLLARGTC